MSFRFQKRINLGKGLSLNISKTGISPSFRTKAGSISTKGYSVRTGVSGINYRKSFSKSSKSGCMLSLIIFIASGLTLIIAL